MGTQHGINSGRQFIQIPHGTYLEFLHITADLQQAMNRLNKPLIVMVAHPLNLFVVRPNAGIQMIKKLLWLRTFIDRPSQPQYTRVLTADKLINTSDVKRQSVYR